MGLSDDLGTVSTWMERGVFAGTLLLALYLGATGPWQAGGVAGNGPCPVTGDASTVPLPDGQSADDLGAVEVYVSAYPAHAGGAQCEHRSLERGERATVEGVTVAVTGDGAVTVDGNRLGEDQTWSKRARYVDSGDPWFFRTSSVRFLNAGETGVGDASTDRDVRLVTGTGNHRASLNLVVAATFFSSLLVAIGIGLEWSVRYSNVDLYRDDPADRQRNEAGDTKRNAPGDRHRDEPGP